MKKILSTVLVLLTLCEAAFAFPADTSGWVCTPGHVDVTASEIDLNSDIKNDFRVYQTTVTNLTSSPVDVFIPSNQNSNPRAVHKIKL